MKKDNLKVKFLIGIPAAGKSTWAKEFVRNNPNWTRINRDDYRFMTKNSPICEPKIEDMITEMFADATLTALRFKQNVIIDNTNLKSEYILPLVKLVEEYADVEYQIFDCSVDKAIERDEAREKRVGPEVIKKMYKNYVNLLETFDFKGRKKKDRIFKTDAGWDKKLPNAAIFDIDGTLAHMNGRRGPFDWEKVDVDALDPYVARMVKIHKSYGDTIIILSGRDGSCEALTKEWLDFYEIPYDFVFMRKPNDFRKDSVIKKEIYKGKVIGRFNIVAIYDDREQVVEMIRNELGLKVFQVEPGRF